MLTKYKYHCTRWVKRPVGMLARMGVTPNGLTLFSLLMGVVTSLSFVWHSSRSAGKAIRPLYSRFRA